MDEGIENAMNEWRAMGWIRFLDERERRLLANCRNYVGNDPAGMPGHNLAIIINKMAIILDRVWDDSIEGKFTSEKQ